MGPRIQVLVELEAVKRVLGGLELEASRKALEEVVLVEVTLPRQ